MSAAMQRVLDALRGHGGEPRDQGDGYLAQCPVAGHGKGRGDVNPSLSIREGDDGRALLTCHADCRTEDVVAALGLTMADLFEPKQAAEQWRIVDTYPYVDENGEVLFEVVRFEPKDFRQRRPKKGGGWVWNLKGVRRIPYRLPSVLAAVKAGTTIYVVEGERDVDAAEAVGAIATTNPGGAGKWRKEYSEALRGANVVIVADRDEPGRRHAYQVARSLAGIAATVLIVEAVEGKDLADHLAAGKTLEELVSVSKPDPDLTDGRTFFHPLTDTGNAERLIDFKGPELRHCHLWKKWLVWDGIRWRADDSKYVVGLTKYVVRLIRKEAEKCDDPDIAEKIEKWSLKSESLGARTAMATLATSERGIPIQPDVLNRDPWLLTCANGTLDLRTGQLRPASRDDFITKLTPIEYDPNAICPLWDRFLEQILPDPEVRDFVQRAVGWSFTGDVSEQVLFFCYGLGANGKSTFLRVLLRVLGIDYAIQVAPDLLIEKQNRGHPTDLADLFGVRLAVTVEIGAGKKLDEVLVKQLTGGDIIRARRMREDFWQFEPTHKLWIAANHKPSIHGTDEAIWRRLMLVPFTVTIPKGERDRHLLEKLCQELPGILAWAVRGCQAWHAHGLAAPEQVLAATRDYRTEMDVLGDFLEVMCVRKADAFVHASDLYKAFNVWAEANGEEPQTQQQFGQGMTERGFVRVKRRGRKVYKGLDLRHGPGPDGPGGRGGPLPISTVLENQAGGQPSAPAAAPAEDDSPESSPSSPRGTSRPADEWSR